MAVFKHFFVVFPIPMVTDSCHRFLQGGRSGQRAVWLYLHECQDQLHQCAVGLRVSRVDVEGGSHGLFIDTIPFSVDVIGGSQLRLAAALDGSGFNVRPCQV